MADFTINFQANTSGDHYVGYRTYDSAPSTYTIITVNVVTPGPQTVDINIPGSLYCADLGIRYTGYIIAACQVQDDLSPVDGIPDLAIQWTVDLLQQTDPCTFTTITCESVPIQTITITDAAGSCTDGTYPLAFAEVTPGDEVLPADIDVTVTGGIVVSYVINDPGLYKAAPVVTSPSVPSCGSDPAYVANMGFCPVLDLSAFVCAENQIISGSDEYVLALGDDLELCTDSSTLAGLPTGYAETGTDGCKCQGCNNVTVDVTSFTGTGTISFQACWDDSHPLYNGEELITQEIVGGNLYDLNCILEDTLYIDEGSLTGSPVIVSTACS